MIKKIVLTIKNIVKKNPILKKIVLTIIPNKLLEKIVYNNNTSQNLNIYKQFKIDDNRILNFSLAPLEDKRGIGRVCQEQLKYLENNLEEIIPNDELENIYFYTSIHFCPDKLFKNSIVMIHDVIPIVLKELFPVESKIWLEKFKNISEQAERIITISETSKKDIVKYLSIDKSKITIIPNGVTKFNKSKEIELKLPEKYFLYIGSSDKHKNLDVIFRALSLDKKNNINLVLIGSNKDQSNKVKKLKIKDKVTFLGFLTDDEINYVVSNSIGLLFPSLYEGFGLPPMESALLKIPSICSNKPTMTEFFDKDSCLFADPFDDEKWLKNMEELYTNKQLQITIGENAYKRIKELTWEKSMSKFVNEIKEYKFI